MRQLRRLLHWGQSLETEGLASLYTSIGMVVIWNEKGAALLSISGCEGYGETPWRSASRTISTRPFAPSLARIREM